MKDFCSHLLLFKSKILITLFLYFYPHASLAQISAEKFTLDNGLQVVALPNHIAPVVTQMLWYKAGSSLDPEGKKGIAHILEHMMFKGTKTIAPGEFSRTISNLGGNDNAFTTRDYTVYHQTVPSNKVELVMELEADRMRNLLFREEDFLNEKNVVIEERNTRINNSPKNFLHEKMISSLFHGHPYSSPVLGSEETIKSVTSENAYDFYKKHYSPNNAVLVVAGDITVDQVKTLAEKFYGKIENLSENNVDTPRSFDLKPNKQTVTHKDKKVKQSQYSRYYLAPNHKTEFNELTYPTVVLSHLLGSGEASRLYRKLVRGKASATHIGTYYNDISEGPSLLYLNAYPSQNVKIEDMKSEIDEEIKNVIENGFSEDEINRAKSELVAAAIYARDGIFPMAQIIGETVTFGLDINYINEWEDNINNVDTDDIKEAAKLILSQMTSIEGILLPEDNQ